MTKAPLGDVADFVNGFAFKPSDWREQGHPIIRIQNLTDPRKPHNRTTRDVPQRYFVERGDLLVSWSASLGVFTWDRSETGLVNQHIFRVIPDESRVTKEYLRHMLVGALDDMKRHLHGATMQHVNRGEFLATQIPLPPLDEQRRVAATLDQAEALCAKRRQTLAHHDELGRAILYDRFGDPRDAGSRYPRGVLGDLIHAAVDGPHVSPKYASEGVPFLSTRHVRPGRIEWTDLKFLSVEDAKAQWRKCKPEFGDVLYTKGGTTGMAAAVRTTREFAVWVHVAVLKTRRDVVDPTWLEAMLNSPYCYAQSQRFTRGIVNRDLGLKRMVNIELPIPPLSEQKQFAELVAQVAIQRQEGQRAAQRHDELFTSLRVRAFRGEL